MTPLAFFRERAVRELLARAAKAAGIPLSLHYLNHGEESPKIAAWGGCAACAYVATLPDGHKRCRDSRSEASLSALRQDRAFPYLCHMGFACVSIPALKEEGYVLTFGPYAPSGATDSLEHDACRGLKKLTGKSTDAFPLPLADIRHAPVDSVPALAEWTVEGLSTLWTRCEAEESAAILDAQTEAAPAPQPIGRHRPAPPPVSDPYAAPAIAAAIAAGDQPGARELLRGVLEEAQAQSRRKIQVQRGRTVAAVGAILEALENTGVDTAPGWNAFPMLVDAARQARDLRGMLDAAMEVIAPLRRRAAKAPSPAMDYAALSALLSERLVEGLTLEEAAKHLGESATALSHRLRRKFGMSYSEYLGRLRISRAKDLLRRTRMSAADIGVRVGIGDQSNFSKLFRKFEGMSPLEYRQQFGRKK